jgi:hypothetical protein
MKSLRFWMGCGIWSATTAASRVGSPFMPSGLTQISPPLLMLLRLPQPLSLLELEEDLRGWAESSQALIWFATSPSSCKCQ